MSEVMCRECGKPTMHVGNVCYGCNNKPNTSPVAAAATGREIGGEFSTEGVKRIAAKFRAEGRPILASAMVDLAEQRDSLASDLDAMRENYTRAINDREAAEAETDRMLERAIAAENDADAMRAERDALRARLEQAEKDAARIDWLAADSNCRFLPKRFDYVGPVGFRQAIDAAMQERA